MQGPIRDDAKRCGNGSIDRGVSGGSSGDGGPIEAKRGRSAASAKTTESGVWREQIQCKKGECMQETLMQPVADGPTVLHVASCRCHPRDLEAGKRERRREETTDGEAVISDRGGYSHAAGRVLLRWEGCRSELWLEG
jgi:hypothetical protein